WTSAWFRSPTPDRTRCRTPDTRYRTPESRPVRCPRARRRQRWASTSARSDAPSPAVSCGRPSSAAPSGSSRRPV
ncbi:MAG: hypothetical protein AVDCRST_MAG59-3403, partial [uncultured Thermomicrobiales bacterium]